MEKQPLEAFCKKGVLRNFSKFTGKHLSQSLFLIKLQAETCNFIKKRLRHMCFSECGKLLILNVVVKNLCNVRCLSIKGKALVSSFRKCLEKQEKPYPTSATPNAIIMGTSSEFLKRALQFY